MRYVRDQTGRFPERPHYEPKEIGTMFEHIVVGLLKARHGQVEFPFTTEDLTVLIEQETADLDPYADLSGYGAGVEGVTEFWPGRKPSVKSPRNLPNQIGGRTATGPRFPMNMGMCGCTDIFLAWEPAPACSTRKPSRA